MPDHTPRVHRQQGERAVLVPTQLGACVAKRETSYLLAAWSLEWLSDLPSPHE